MTSFLNALLEVAKDAGELLTSPVVSEYMARTRLLRIKARESASNDALPEYRKAEIRHLLHVCSSLKDASKALENDPISYQHAMVLHRRVFKCIARLCGNVLGSVWGSQKKGSDARGGKRGKKKRRDSAQVAEMEDAFIDCQMTAEELELVPADMQESLSAVLLDESVSPTIVQILSAFPPSFVTSNKVLFNALLLKVTKHNATSTEAYLLLNPPYYSFSSNSTVEVAPEIISALLFLIEHGTEASQITDRYPHLVQKCLSVLNDRWKLLLSETESHISANSTLQLPANVYDILRSIKSISRIISSVKKSNPNIELTNHLTMTPFPAVAFVSSLTALRWIIFEINKFFKTVSLKLDDDTFMEGPLPLFPDYFRIVENTPEYRNIALRLAVGDFATGNLPRTVLNRIFEFALGPLGYSESSGEWGWVKSICSNAESNKLNRSNAVLKIGTEAYEIKGGDGNSSDNDAPLRDNQTIPSSKEEASCAVQYYTNDAPILFVMDQVSLALFKESTREETCNCLSLDCEWKPDVRSAIEEQNNPAATLQVAVWKQDVDEHGKRLGTGQHLKVFVLGLAQIPEKDFVEIFGPLFSSSNILKLGFGFNEDIMRLQMRYPTFSGNITNLFDMSIPNAKQISRKIFNRKRISLSDLVFGYLSVRIEKIIRLSNWEMRPLTLRQLKYAANDVLAMVDVYVEMIKSGDSESGMLFTSKPLEAEMLPKSKKQKHTHRETNEAKNCNSVETVEENQLFPTEPVEG